MIKQLVKRTPFILLSLLLLAGCHSEGEGHASADGHDGAEEAAVKEVDVPEDKLVLEFPNAVEIMPGVWAGGQPTREQLQAAAEAGVKTVVNMRTLGEEGAWDEREFVEGLGMRFEHIPVAGPPGITPENARLLAAITDDEQTHPLMVHCASGRRISALIALEPKD